MLWDQIVELLQDPDTWSGPNGIPALTWEHVWISLAATAIAVLFIFPLGLWLGHRRRGAEIAGVVVNIGRAIPSFGVLVLTVMVLVELGASVLTPWPVLIALIALAAPPIFTNTITGIQEVDRSTIEAGRGMGLTEGQIVGRVEMPLASPVIIEGLRVALVQVIATVATLGALVAWGGLGRLIVDGFNQRNNGKVLVGAALVGLLAVIAEVGLSAAGKAATPRGLRTGAS